MNRIRLQVTRIMMIPKTRITRSESSNSSQFDDITSDFDDQESENDDMSCPTEQENNEEGKGGVKWWGILMGEDGEGNKAKRLEKYLKLLPVFWSLKKGTLLGMSKALSGAQ
ncbi:hypothetical protein HAX54_000822 [Datura stramonium]|uniref:Uncharacterized protein n=1 Tax=Datura stramonium TaxID=4076 RepID=A0ABS8WSS2_DATST|nr:hypothetical protein [Datura stramonium]